MAGVGILFFDILLSLIRLYAQVFFRITPTTQQQRTPVVHRYNNLQE